MRNETRTGTGNIYVYNTDNDDQEFDENTSLNQDITQNSLESFYYPCGGVGGVEKFG